MGLDSVELVMATEEEFGIEISDQDAWELTTPRQLAEYVAMRLAIQAKSDEPHCRSQAHFYWLRANLVEHLKLKRSGIRPDTPIRELLPGDLRAQWRSLQKSAALRCLPNLRAPAFASYLAFLPIGIAVTIGVVKQLERPAFSLIGIIGLTAWAGSEALNRYYAKQLPPSIDVVKDLLPYIGLPAKQFASLDEILQRSMQITAEQLGIPLERIHPDHHFIKDLGMDQ